MKNKILHDTVTSLVLMIAAVLILISLVSDLIGPVGQWARTILEGLFGAGAIWIPAVLVYIAVRLILRKNRTPS